MIGAYLQVTQRFRYSDAVHRRYKTKICKKFGRQPCYVYNRERKNYKPCGFNRLPILFEIVQQNIISLNKQGSSNWRQTCENVSSTRMILPTLHVHTVDKSSQSHGTVYMMS
jgi:hypothetical protein